MNAKLEVGILRTHSEYVAQLATELTSTLRALEDALSEQTHQPDTPTSGHTERITELQRLLTTEAPVLCQRLQGFLEQISQLCPGEYLVLCQGEVEG
jgi:hypothetical protein